ncbi:MAG: class I SAM-dependent methyltransferase [Candidatus Thorarchaeota archaeon]
MVEPHEMDAYDGEDTIPFTARLMAYYRALESKMECPLIIDPFAERLAGDFSEYARKHKRTVQTGDYVVIRSYYIESNLLLEWCKKHSNSQVVLFGAGLDSRAYRFTPLKSSSQTIFEIDLPNVIRYKEEALKGEEPLCQVVRISSDLSKKDWSNALTGKGFSHDIPTFWILEGLAYYLEQSIVLDILRNLWALSHHESEVFLDICHPGLSDMNYGAFTRHFRWGLLKEQIVLFFQNCGWNVTWSYADDHDQGRDVGQKGLIFVHGTKASEIRNDSEVFPASARETPAKKPHQIAAELATTIIPGIQDVVRIYTMNRDEGVKSYLSFVRGIKPYLDQIASGFKYPVELGHISPRLLGDPFSIEAKGERFTDDERESFVTGYLQAIIQFVYCAIRQIEGRSFHGTKMHSESQKNPASDGITSCLPLLRILENEVS